MRTNRKRTTVDSAPQSTEVVSMLVTAPRDKVGKARRLLSMIGSDCEEIL